MLQNSELKQIFESKYDRQKWNEVTKEIFSAELLSNPKSLDLKNNDWQAKGFELGSFETLDGMLVGIFEINVPVKAKLQHNRKGLRDLLKNEVYRDNIDAALLVFTQGNKWRFSYVSQIRVYNKETGLREVKITDPKRYTYLMGEGERCKTAADRFAGITQEENLFAKGVTIDTLNEAFNVEKMSEAFFRDYRKHYGYFTAFLTGEDENNKKVQTPSGFLRASFENDHKEARDFVKKMMGRIVFLYFLEKKGWLGVPEDQQWGHGNEFFLSDLFKECKEKDSFYSNVLVPLFFDTLNTKRKDDLFKINDNVFIKSGYNRLKIPYLNGGLFEKDSSGTEILSFPKALFHNLFTFFDQYNFTVYEDSPDEHTVAVDPEMLGHIFENLLEDNKDKGAFYTPKEIVHYMCQESLIEYLHTKLESNTDKENIERFIKNQEAAGIVSYAEEILQSLYDVKVCDPAIGSGAFPMGILMEILHAVETLYYLNPDVAEKIWKLKKGWEPARVKASIIQHSIYGVDIEQGAVDIARLRFWLSLVVDEDEPQPLPNLDYKIIVGDSLVSKFEEQIIEIDWDLIIPGAITDEVKKIRKIQKAVQDKLKNLFEKQDQFFNYEGDKSGLKEEIRLLKIEVLIEQLQVTLAKDNLSATQSKLFEKEPKKDKNAIERLNQKMAIETAIIKLNRLKNSPALPLHFFDWKFDFPEVMNTATRENGGLITTSGFDIVIGNPPYVNFRFIKSKEIKAIYLRKFITAEYQSDLFILFIEKAYQILNRKGKLSYIVPNSLTNNLNNSKIRKFILDNSSISSMVNTPIGVFENATVDTIIISTSLLRIKRGIDAFEFSTKGFIKIQETDQTTFLSNLNYNFDFLIKKEDKFLLSKIEESSILLKDVTDSTSGIKEYETGKGNPAQTKEDCTNKIFNSDKKIDHLYLKHLTGSEIEKYFILWKSSYLKYGPWLAAPRDKKYFSGERIIIREIPGKKSLKVAYIEDCYTTKNTAHIFKSINENFPNKYLCGILNSKLIWFYFKNKFSENDTVFPKAKIGQCRLIPIKISKNPKLVTNIVDEILELNSKGLPTLNAEKILDSIVYRIYELSYDEVKTIEPNFDQSIEQYEKISIT